MWDTPTVIATAIGAAGLLLALIGLWLQLRTQQGLRRAQEVRITLSEQLSRASDLLQEVHDGDPTRDFGELDRRIARWRDETLAILRRSAPEFVSVFESSAGMTFFSSQHGERDRLGDYLRGRMQRLGEIIGQL